MRTLKYLGDKLKTIICPCCTFGEFKNQVCMPIHGKVQCIDYCIHHIVAALNAGGVETVASCCGHNKLPGIINLEDGTVLGVFKNQEEFDKYCINKDVQ